MFQINWPKIKCKSSQRARNRHVFPIFRSANNRYLHLAFAGILFHFHDRKKIQIPFKTMLTCTHVCKLAIQQAFYPKLLSPQAGEQFCLRRQKISRPCRILVIKPSLITMMHWWGEMNVTVSGMTGRRIKTQDFFTNCCYSHTEEKGDKFMLQSFKRCQPSGRIKLKYLLSIFTKRRVSAFSSPFLKPWSNEENKSKRQQEDHPKGTRPLLFVHKTFWGHPEMLFFLYWSCAALHQPFFNGKKKIRPFKCQYIKFPGAFENL